MSNKFDIVVVGGGAGGLFAASVANALGAKTCMIDKKRLGGDCTWFGCMPSKALLKSASVANLFNSAVVFGLDLEGNLKINTDKVMSHVRDVVREISTHHPNEVFEKRGIKVIIGAPRFIDKNTVEVNPVRDFVLSRSEKGISNGVNGDKITSKKFIICTGSRPVILPIEGLEKIDYLTNENIFDLDKLPQSLIVLGGGPIGVELAQGLHRLGVKVFIVEMVDRILFREDKEAAEVLEKSLKKEGINVLAGKKAVKFSKKDGLVVAVLEDKDKNTQEISAERVLVALGRAPNLEGLSLESANVKYDKKGINVNSYLQTTNRNIFACGDVVGPYMFSHVAAYQAGVCVRNAIFKRIARQRVNYQNIAWATFTEPELSHLGLTEEEAKNKYKVVNVYKNEYKSSDRAVTDLEKDGLVKIITDKKGYIVGAHIVGAHASEIIQGLLIAKSLKAPLSKIAPILFIYPTLSELVKKTAAKTLIEKMNNSMVKFVLKVMKKI